MARAPISDANAAVISQFALTWWQEGKFGFGQNQFIGLYAGLGISSAIFTFVLGAATIWFGTTAARNLHHMALEKVRSLLSEGHLTVF